MFFDLGVRTGVSMGVFPSELSWMLKLNIETSLESEGETPFASGDSSRLLERLLL